MNLFIHVQKALACQAFDIMLNNNLVERMALKRDAIAQAKAVAKKVGGTYEGYVKPKKANKQRV